MTEGAVISIVGSHAGESIQEIFERKQVEIKKVGYTYWLYKSHSARPEVVQKLASLSTDHFRCYFISASSKSGARPTTEQKVAKFFSLDGIIWQEINKSLLVTGSSRSAFALVIKKLEIKEGEIDLWSYSSFPDANLPLKTRLGDSTLPAIKKPSGEHPEKMRSNKRKVLAVGELSYPYCVWLKTSV